MQRIGGVTSFFVLLLAFLFFSYLIYFTMQCRSIEILNKKKALKDTIYQAWEDQDEISTFKVSENDFSIKDQDIWSHTHRVYLMGHNSAAYPWTIPKFFPRDALAKQDIKKLCEFIDSYNSKL